MTYLKPHNRPASAQARTIVSSIFGLILIIGLVQWLAPHFLPGLFTSIAAPFWRTEFSIRSGSLDSPQSLLSQNEELRTELDSFAVTSETIQAVQDENDELKAFLGRPVATSTPMILSQSGALASTPTMAVGTIGATSSSVTIGSSSPLNQTSAPSDLPQVLKSLGQKFVGKVLAAVLVHPPLAAYDEFIIDIGEDFAVAVSDNVYAPGNVLIGRISEVLGHTSTVTLFSSPGETYSVLIGQGPAPATAIGLGGGQYQAQLPRNVDVSPGDSVVVPSISTTPFGVVTSVDNDPAQAFETILFAPPVNMYQLRWVLVDTKK